MRTLPRVLVRVLVNGLRSADDFLTAGFDRAFPLAANPWRHLGALAFLCLVIAIATGVIAYALYDTSVHGAYESGRRLQEDPLLLGRLLRGLHRYAADACLLLTVLHLLREIAHEHFRAPRLLSWLTGLPLAWLLWVAGLSGLWLLWDERALYSIAATAEWLQALPLAGEQLARNFLTPEALNDRFFSLVMFAHIGVPLLMLGTMWVHVQRMEHSRVWPPRALALGSLATFALLALAVPAESLGPPRHGELAATMSLDWFYQFLHPLAEALSARTVWVLAASLTLALALLPLLPRASGAEVRAPTPRRAMADVDYGYDLDVPRDARRPLVLAWLALGLAALLASGLFSILLVLSRTPQLMGLFPVADFFRVALVVHVDLSVLVWFLAFGGALWTLNGALRYLGLAWLAFAMAAAGAAVMCAAPFAGRAAPVMANYVPVLDGPVFLAGLVLFGAGIALLCLQAMLAVGPVGTRIRGAGALRFGLNAAVVATAVAACAFAWSWYAVPRGLDARIYYELLFWGGGHVLQFAYTLLMLVGWVWLAARIGARVPLSPRVLTLLFAIALLSVFLTPVTYLAYDLASVEFHHAQTLLMRFGGGLVIPPVAIAVLGAIWRLRAAQAVERPLRAALIASVALFCAGGLIGFLIAGNNVRIPAHYHGSIVGVTLAMMGVVYLLLPRLGFAAPDSRLAAWQPYVYGTGQLLHILGLVWSGGYGVQRKVAGADQGLEGVAQTTAMGLMGLGGLLAVAGGILFVVVVLQSLRRGR
jgi:quinol-cytochrome oxidoreductase complex cytochrome b subunit